MIHDFKQKNQFADRHAVAWEDWYHHTFPDLIAALPVPSSNNWYQIHGVDRVLVFPNNKLLLVDEKTRKGDYRDILLEEWSKNQTAVGWTLDENKITDYVAYSVPAIGRCYLLPFYFLRKAFARNLPEWKKQYYYPLEAVNEGYTTINIAIPVGVVYRAIVVEMVTQFSVT